MSLSHLFLKVLTTPLLALDNLTLYLMLSTHQLKSSQPSPLPSYFLPRTRKGERKREKKREGRGKEKGSAGGIKGEEEGVLMPSRYITYHGKQRKTAQKSKRYNETLILVDFDLLDLLLFECLGMCIMILCDDLGSLNMFL